MLAFSAAALPLDSYTGYGALLAFTVLAYYAGQRLSERRSRRVKQEAVESGRDEPPSLHPVIDPVRCIGCGACVSACPEGNILGLIAGKAELIEPAACIGHGACKTACPADAISLVFGTATRGVDIPHVSPTFESNIPGIYIAGELGGMGLIANAVEQGRQAMASIAKLDGRGRADRFDVVIVGSGPAGLSASLAAREAGLSFVTLDQASFGGTVAHYPRGKIAMTRPARLPLVGRVRFRRVRKERLLAFWSDIAKKHRLPLRFGERVESIGREVDGTFAVTTPGSVYPARAVLLAVGRRGSPLKLDVPGEDLPKVVYSLIEPAQYRGQRVLVVGGGDSAAETVIALARLARTTVTLAVRSGSLARAKPANRQRIDALVARGRIELLADTTVTAIAERSVELVTKGRRHRIGNDAVIVCAGGTLPGEWLGRLGIRVETRYGTAA